MSIRKWSGRALCVAVLAGSLTACDFIQPITEDPNTVPSATLDQLIVGSSVNFMRLQVFVCVFPGDFLHSPRSSAVGSFSEPNPGQDHVPEYQA